MSESSILTRQPHGRACPLHAISLLLNAYPCPSMVCRETIPWLAFFCLLVQRSLRRDVKHQHALPAHSSWLATNRVCIYVIFFFFSPSPIRHYIGNVLAQKERSFLFWPDHLPHTVRKHIGRWAPGEEIVGIVEKHREQQKQQRM